MTIIASAIGDGIRFIFEARESRAGTVEVGGLGEIGHLAGNHFLVSFVAVLIAIVIAMPVSLWLGHIGKGQFLAGSVANIGRAVPSLAIIAFFVAFLGSGFTNVCFALILLAIPPILTNTYVGVRQVDRELVDAARGQGMSETQIVRRIELPLALPTIFAGLRLSTVAVLATATIGPLANVLTLGRPIIEPQTFGVGGQVGAAILVATVTLLGDLIVRLIQNAATPKGLKLQREAERSRKSLTLSPIRRESTT